MAISIGAMVERLLIQYNAASTNTHGSKTPGVWTTLNTVCAEHMPLSGAERLEAERIGSTVTLKFRIWARTDVTAKMRALWTPSWPSGSPRRVVEFHAIYPDPNDHAFQVIEASTHDATPIPDVSVPNPSWTQEGWI
jgi:SPP1 family predicted phage head-tail adaptor